jgi:hypothetical protein
MRDGELVAELLRKEATLEDCRLRVKAPERRSR